MMWMNLAELIESCHHFLKLKNGGMPCGWNGQFPEGQMVVYNHVYRMYDIQ